MYFKETWQCVAEKDLLFGRVSIFQAGPSGPAEPVRQLGRPLAA